MSRERPWPPALLPLCVGAVGGGIVALLLSKFLSDETGPSPSQQARGPVSSRKSLDSGGLSSHTRPFAGKAPPHDR